VTSEPRPYLREPPRPPPDPPPPDGVAARPRPFILTAGRVAGTDPDIALETQVTAREPPPGALPVTSLAPELRAIVALAARPISVAEISALVPLHLGVAQILVADLRASGHLDVHTETFDPHDPDLILRVIRGLRSIA
jgi:Protein of unknown function (DUF742)